MYKSYSYYLRNPTYTNIEELGQCAESINIISFSFAGSETSGKKISDTGNVSL